jgi:ankyrin repeat protein
MAFTQDVYRRMFIEAIKSNELESVLRTLEELRIAHPSDFVNNDHKGNTVLHLIARMPISVAILDVILHPCNRMYSGRIDSRNSMTDTALSIAAEGACVSVVSGLIDKGADVNDRGNLQKTPLHYACSHYIYPLDYPLDTKHVEQIITILLKNNANINARNVWCQTPLGYGVQAGLLGPVRLLLEHGADMSMPMDRRSLIHSAIIASHGLPSTDAYTGIDMIELLIAYGAEMDTIYQGETPLQLAASGGFRGEIDISRYAVRLLTLVLMEIPSQIEEWSDENSLKTNLAVAMSHHERLGVGSLLNTIPSEQLASILNIMRRDTPPSMASAALYALKERYIRLPILDSDCEVIRDMASSV